MNFRICRKVVVCGGILFCASGQLIGQIVGTMPQAPAAALLSRMKVAQKTWKEQDGSRLLPVIMYTSDTPTCTVTVLKNSPPDESNLNKVAIVTALEFLLADDAFEQVRLSVVEYNPRRFAERTTKEQTIKRVQLRAAAIGAAKTLTIKDAIDRARGDQGVLAQICDQLGLN